MVPFPQISKTPKRSRGLPTRPFAGVNSGSAYPNNEPNWALSVASQIMVTHTNALIFARTHIGEVGPNSHRPSSPPKKQRNQKRICLFRRKIRFPNAKLLCFPTQWVLNPKWGVEFWMCALSTKPGCDAFYIANRTFVLMSGGGGRFGVWNSEPRNQLGMMGLSNNVLEIIRWENQSK